MKKLILLFALFTATIASAEFPGQPEQFGPGAEASYDAAVAAHTRALEADDECEGAVNAAVSSLETLEQLIIEYQGTDTPDDPDYQAYLNIIGTLTIDSNGNTVATGICQLQMNIQDFWIMAGKFSNLANDNPDGVVVDPVNNPGITTSQSALYITATQIYGIVETNADQCKGIANALAVSIQGSIEVYEALLEE